MNSFLRFKKINLCFAVSAIFLFVFLFEKKSLFSIPVANKSGGYVEVLLSLDNTIYEQSLYGIQSVIDSEVRITYLNILNEEQGALAKYFRELESSDVPLLIAVGPLAAKTAKENLNKTPIVFTMVNSPKSLGLESGRLCGVSMDVSIQDFFQTLKEINPDARNVYSAYSTEEGGYSATEGEYEDLKNKLLFNAKKTANGAEFSKYLETISEETDGFYMVSDPIYDRKNFEILSAFCKKHRIVLMTPFPSLVKTGATFGISPDYTKIGVLTGSMANRILSGSSHCKKEGVIWSDQTSFYLNEEYANESGLKIPQSIADRAKLTGLLAAGVNLLNDDKLKAAKSVFESILKKDAKNPSAISYLNLIVEKMTGTKTKELMASAKKYFDEGKYSQARTEYQKVLQINPNIIPAREGIQATLLTQSEQERAQANSLFRNDRPYDAIKMALASIRTLPSNLKAVSDLAGFRNNQFSKIPEYFKEGLTEYNKREYELSIKIFEDILLVDPGDKKAIEYLRLSYKKRDALRLMTEKSRD
ncbi:ABC transporter substrate binding protein [Leptospira ilyithenensis]|nr:ABC transporter substrate binding protein [Leptospira ilyithenensis]